jgi:PEGA domain-containing protein
MRVLFLFATRIAAKIRIDLSGVVLPQEEENLRWPWMLTAFCCLAVLLPGRATAKAQNQVMGELEFDGKTKLEQDAGVWIDGNYVGYLKELKGKKKIVLLPGQHEVVVRQSGYLDNVQKVLVQPGEKRLVSVKLEMAPHASQPNVTAKLKLSIKPKRAAVFLDEKYVGHASEFGGRFRSMEISPGKHKIRVELPGYRTFVTEVDLLANQETEVKTELQVGSIEQNSPIIKKPD